MNIRSLFCALLLVAYEASASNRTLTTGARYELQEHSNEVPISATLLLEDQDKNLDFEKLLQLDQEKKLDWKLNKSMSLGYSSSRVWIKFEVKNISNVYSEWVLEQRYSLIQTFDIYIKKGNQVESFKTGRLRPFGERPFKHRYFIYPVKIEKGDTLVVYAKLESKSPLQLILTLYEKNHFLDSSSFESILLGLYLGAMASMIVIQPSTVYWD